MSTPIDINLLSQGDFRTLAKAITLVENNLPEGKVILQQLNFAKQVPVVGITGPPGAGKSSLVNALVKLLLEENKKVGILAVDPTSPFNYGSLLGDRIRMSEHFMNDNVYIRSLATRGSLGGLSAKIFEICDVMKQAGFDMVLIETVGVGQSEVEIAGLADTTAVVLVPEAGDEVQTLKSGLMEIADIFVVNKSDRDGADLFVKNLSALAHQKATKDSEIPVLKTVASNGTGVDELYKAILKHNLVLKDQEKRLHLMTEKAYQLIIQKRMEDIGKADLFKKLSEEANKTGFNLYQYIEDNYSQ